MKEKAKLRGQVAAARKKGDVVPSSPAVASRRAIERAPATPLSAGERTSAPANATRKRVSVMKKEKSSRASRTAPTASQTPDATTTRRRLVVKELDSPSAQPATTTQRRLVTDGVAGTIKASQKKAAKRRKSAVAVEERVDASRASPKAPRPKKSAAAAAAADVHVRADELQGLSKSSQHVGKAKRKRQTDIQDGDTGAFDDEAEHSAAVGALLKKVEKSAAVGAEKATPRKRTGTEKLHFEENDEKKCPWLPLAKSPSIGELTFPLASTALWNFPKVDAAAARGKADVSAATAEHVARSVRRDGARARRNATPVHRKPRRAEAPLAAAAEDEPGGEKELFVAKQREEAGGDNAPPPTAISSGARWRAQSQTPRRVGAKEAPSGAVIYIGHLPHGFYESELREYFVQYGEVSNVKVSRSKKTARSRGYAFVEFQSEDVARIAAQSMNGYLMFGQILDVHVVEPEKVHPELFRGTRRRFKAIPWRVIDKRRRNEPRDSARLRELHSKLLRGEEERRRRLSEMGVEYDFPGYSAAQKTSA